MDSEIPLCIKLNYTLIATNIVLEALVQLLNQNPLLIFRVPFWLLRGRLYFEEKVFTKCEINIQLLPFRKKVIDFIESHKNNNRKIILLDTVYVDYVRLFGGSLKVFDGVIVADNNAILLKKVKQNYKAGYDFIGSSAEDMVLFENARLCYLVEPSPTCLAQARKTANVETIFKAKRDKIKLFFQTIHIERTWWLLPIFLPLLLNQFTIFGKLPTVIGAFLLYLSVAFGLFILNDIYNVNYLRQPEGKRKHPLPIAFGLFKIVAGLKLSVFFLILGVSIALIFFSVQFNLLLFLFLGFSFCFVLAYSRSKALRNILLLLLSGILTFAGYVLLIFNNSL